MMAWECGECNAREDKHTRIHAVCHHCGKPLCREDQVWIVDFVFADEPGPIGQEAVHCRPCMRRHHPMDLHLSRKSQ
jgi:hypothetical protein